MSSGSPKSLSPSESVSCPSDCSGCGDTKTVTISGLTGTTCPCLNGNYTLTRTGCEWNYGNEWKSCDCVDGHMAVYIDLYCENGCW